MIKNFDVKMTCDFETVVLDNVKTQTSTEVWVAASAKLWSDETAVYNNIQSFFYYLSRQGKNVLCYWHNLKWDGEFFLSYLLEVLKFKNAIGKDGKWLPEHKMPPNSVEYLISTDNYWYCIKVKLRDTFIVFWDSLKIIPFSAEQIGIDFKTKHQKLKIDYIGDRKPYGRIKPNERQYILNDVLIMKEAMEIAIEMGLDEMTLGSCCMKEFKKGYSKKELNELFPDLRECKMDQNVFGVDNVWDFVHKAYGGGWQYGNAYHEPVIRKKKFEFQNVKYSGITVDANAHYSSQMHSGSGNKFPVGKGTVFVGKPPEEALQEDKFMFIKVKTKFELKDGYLPTISIRHNLLYNSKEWLRTSKILYQGEYYDEVIDKQTGEIITSEVELIMTEMDFVMMCKHYKLENFKVIGGVYFDTKIGLFDEYINKYQEIKSTSTGARKTIAKLMMNNLGGKFATHYKANTRVINGVDKDGALKWGKDIKSTKTPGYIPVAAALTSYGRCKTISICQSNIKYFKYADTDSGHFECAMNQIVGVELDDKKLGCWKVESLWDEANFVKGKTYIEHIVAEKHELVEPYYNIKCAGLPSKGKMVFAMSMEKYKPTDEDIKDFDLDKDCLDVINKEYKIDDFKQGLKLPGKLIPIRIKGGVVLEKEIFTLT